MAGSDYVTPTSNFLPGTIARAEDINEKMDAIEAGFGKLPRPRADARTGFADPLALPDPTDDDHAVPKLWLLNIVIPIQNNITSIQDALNSLTGNSVTPAEMNAALNDLNIALSASIALVNSTLTQALADQDSAHADAINAVTQLFYDAIDSVVENLPDYTVEFDRITALEDYDVVLVNAINENIDSIGEILIRIGNLELADQTHDSALSAAGLRLNNLDDLVAGILTGFAGAKVILDSTYTIESGDSDKYLLFSNANPVTVTLPDGDDEFLGVQQGTIIQLGEGAVTLVGNGVTIHSSGDIRSTFGPSSWIRYLRADETTWMLSATPPTDIPLAIKTITDNEYILQPGDENFVLWVDSDEPCFITIPSEAQFPFTEVIRGRIIQAGDGAVVVYANANLDSEGFRNNTTGPFSAIDYMHKGVNSWWLMTPPPSGELANLMFSGVYDGYVLTRDDMGGVLWIENDDDVEIAFPDSNGLIFDSYVQGVIIQGGEGKLSFVGDGAAEVVSSNGLASTAAQYSPISYIRIGPNTWWIGGERA